MISLVVMLLDWLAPPGVGAFCRCWRPYCRTSVVRNSATSHNGWCSSWSLWGTLVVEDNSKVRSTFHVLIAFQVYMYCIPYYDTKFVLYSRLQCKIPYSIPYFITKLHTLFHSMIQNSIPLSILLIIGSTFLILHFKESLHDVIWLLYWSTKDTLNWMEKFNCILSKHIVFETYFK